MNQTPQKNEQEQQKHPFKFREQITVFILGMLTWASYPYCFDIPQAVQTQLQLPPYSLSPNKFNSLYVVISLPNIALSFVSGIITSKLGPTKAILLYTITLCIGQGLLTYSIAQLFNGWYQIALVSRIIIGFSGYSLVGANLSLIPKYTEKKLVAFLVGLGSMLPWTTQSITSALSPYIYHITGEVYLPFLVGWFLIIASIHFAFVLLRIDIKFEKRLSKKQDIVENKKISKETIYDLGIMMLMVFIVITFAVSVEGSIIINANDMLHQRVGFTNTQAGTIAMMPLLVNCLTSPLWALIKQKVKHKRRLFPVIGCILMVDILILFFLPSQVNGLSYFMSYLGFILLGVWDSGAVTLIIGSIPAMTPSRVQSIAFSVYTTALALGMGISPLITARII